MKKSFGKSELFFYLLYCNFFNLQDFKNLTNCFCFIINNIRVMKVIIVILAVFFAAQSYAQDYNQIFCCSHGISPSDNGNLYFRFENSNMMKNNEYFNKYTDGYTFLGYRLHPKIVYFSTENTKIELGIQLLKYLGRENFEEKIPTLSFQYHANEYLDIVFGSIYGTVNHKLIEPLFQFERYFTNQNENGLQFLFDFGKFKSDLWLNWENFILPHSATQEQFTIGFSNVIDLGNPDRNYDFSIPIQIIGTHRGGQNLLIDAKIQTIINSTVGINVEKGINTRFLNSIGFQQYILSFYDNSPSKQLPYILGRASLSNITLSYQNFGFILGYWYGDGFISSRGEPMYQSISQINPLIDDTYRSIFLTKFQYQKYIVGNISMGFRFETYYDLLNKTFDYSYGVHITFNKDFFIKKFSNQ